MDIHTMIANASADIRAMESRIQSLIDQLKSSNNECERLRTLNATITAEALHAKADLIHYQNVFVASACVEAMNMCKEFFATTHENMKTRAEDAVKRMVAEKQEAERQSKLDLENDEGFQKPTVTTEQVQASIDNYPTDGTVVSPPLRINPGELKQFYLKSPIKQLPHDWRDRPTFTFTEGAWVKTYHPNTNEPKEIPAALGNYLRTPKEDLRGGVSKLVLGLF